MAIKTGRYGQVKWDAAGTTPVLLISLNAWTGDFKTEMEDVTCFGDVNRVYIPGMKDAKGTHRRLLEFGEHRDLRGGRDRRRPACSNSSRTAPSRRSSGRGPPISTPASTRVCRRRKSRAPGRRPGRS